jgi:hypothetical protein
MSEIWQLPTGALYLPLYIGIITSIERVGGGVITPGAGTERAGLGLRVAKPVQISSG